MSDQSDNKKKLIPFFPDYILDEVIVWYIALAILIVLASLIPAGLEEKANPLVTPEHIKPEWYFLFLYQSLKLVPELVGVMIAPIGVLLLLALPFIDRSDKDHKQAKLIRIGVGVVTLIIVIALTIWGIVS